MIQVTGIYDIVNDLLKALPTGDEVQNILVHNADPLVQDLKSKIPVSDGVTRDNLKVVQLSRKNFIIVGIDYQGLLRKGGKSKRPSNILYFIEEGHRTRSKGKGSATVNARPFIVSTYNVHKERLINSISEDLIKVIETKFNANV